MKDELKPMDIGEKICIIQQIASRLGRIDRNRFDKRKEQPVPEYIQKPCQAMIDEDANFLKGVFWTLETCRYFDGLNVQHLEYLIELAKGNDMNPGSYEYWHANVVHVLEEREVR